MEHGHNTTIRGNVPRGAGALVLYLDFDGVLHHENCLWHPRRGAYLDAPEGHVLFQHADLLAQVLEPYPQWKIVLSTSWVRTYSCFGAAKRLPVSLRERVIGATFHSEMNESGFQSLPRGLQVCNDVERRKPRKWIALDDDASGWPMWSIGHFIQTDQVLGITNAWVLNRLKVDLEMMTKDANQDANK